MTILGIIILIGTLQSQVSPAPLISKCGVAPALCTKLPYRSLDGSCNNLNHPEFGISNSRFTRLLPSKYCDGILTTTCSVSGKELPNARKLSYVLFGEKTVPDPNLTLANMQWGQIIGHDISRLLSAGDENNCCTFQGEFVESAEICNMITLPPDDPVYSHADIKCIRMFRTLTDRDIDCDYEGGPTEQITGSTSFLDLSLVYGSTEEENHIIREFRGGRMILDERDGGYSLPKSPVPIGVCFPNSREEFCYVAGDDRVNQNTGLTVLQTILLREHNRIAHALARLNPHWTDAVLFEESRKINIAQCQHITYYEWMPTFLGTENMLKNRLIYNVSVENHINDYDPSVNPAVLNEHTTAAYRYFHVQIRGRLDLISEFGGITGSLRLSDWYNHPRVLEEGDNFGSLARGLVTEHAALTDNNYDEEIKHFAFRNNNTFGWDVRAIDIQRSRLHGLASYNDAREFCGLKRAVEWTDFEDYIEPEIVRKLESLYESLEDVDLTVGGSLETKIEGTLAGPTFLCILTEQFYRLRVGDRYFYENDDNISGFSSEQLREIRKASFARLMCDSGNRIMSIQPRAFSTVSKSNPIIPCSNIPEIDLSKWIDRRTLIPVPSVKST